MSPTMRCEVDFEVAAPEDFGPLAARWVLGGARALARDVLDRVSADESIPKGRLSNGRPCGPVGAQWGFVSSTHFGKSGLRQIGKVIDETSLAWAEKQAASGIVGLNLGLNVLDSSGLPWDQIIRFEARVTEESPTWCQVWFEAPEASLLGAGAQDAWLAVLRDFCEVVNPSYGQISYDYGAPWETALEAVTGPPWTIPDKAIANSREVLRGYDWLTICADELADRLGGVEALRDSGAFTEVEPLRSGGVWLRATERYADYGEEHIEAVWRALSPVLLKGTPSREMADGSEYPFRLVFRDAADA